MPRKERRKPTLFWTMVLAFVLAIVLGVAGMFGFFSLAIAGVVPVQEREVYRDAPRIFAEWLADYYAARGSWEGVDRRVDELRGFGAFVWVDFALVDTDGMIIAGSADATAARIRLDQLQIQQGVPVLLNDEIVGTLVLRPELPPQPPAPQMHRHSPPDIARSFARSFAMAGGALVLMLTALAVVFSRRISRPLQAITAAAHDVSTGKLDVQAPRAGVHELDELALAFNRMARALAESDRMRRQLTADVAHELRTPLTIIKGRLEGLQDGVYQPTPDQIAALVAETALLERLIEDLRLLALADAGQLPLYHETVDPATLLEAAAASFAAQATASGIQLQVEVPPDLPEVSVDPQRIAQVLANLLGNALRHTPRGGTITLAANQSNDAAGTWVTLSVVDTGSGISPDDLPHVFDRFWRGDRSRARAGGGSGLGLAIAKQIVEAHGGTIAAESAPATGTRILIRLRANIR